jgi:hypothetical protein
VPGRYVGFCRSFILFALYKGRFSVLALATVISLVEGAPWNVISAGFFHTWLWNENALIGVRIGPLPLEEYLFMMLVGAALFFKIILYESAPR